MKPIARSVVVVPFPQLYLAPAVGEPVFAAAFTALKFATFEKARVDEPAPAADIFQFEGNEAVADVPKPLKFSVTAELLGIEICPSPLKAANIITKNNKGIIAHDAFTLQFFTVLHVEKE